jgi:hypothetical protein
VLPAKKNYDFSTKATEADRFYRDCKSVLDMAYAASQMIRTVYDKKGDFPETIEKSKRAIEAAECIYILGYGFDEDNGRLLEMNESLVLGRVRPRTVLFTNYGDSNRINKKVSHLLFQNPHTFLHNPISNHGQWWYMEKSTRKVYDAFEKDFNNVEDGPPLYAPPA